MRGLQIAMRAFTVMQPLRNVSTHAATGTPADAVDAWLPRWHEAMGRVVPVERDWLALQLPQQQAALFLQVRR